MKSNLTFEQLREANRLRLPQFRNNKGETAHASSDGSDWSVAEWFQALVGEVGEYARVRCNYELGVISSAEYATEAVKELPDIAIYLDLLALRSLDTNKHRLEGDAAFILMQLIAAVGEYANAAKKYIRGDIDIVQFESQRRWLLDEAQNRLHALRTFSIADSVHTMWETGPSYAGINMGEAIVRKFNATSAKVGANVTLKE